jgi:hypothetical protein
MSGRPSAIQQLSNLEFVFSQIFVGAGEVVLRELQDVRYIGAIRQVPYRSFEPVRSPQQDRAEQAALRSVCVWIAPRAISCPAGATFLREACHIEWHASILRGNQIGQRGVPRVVHFGAFSAHFPA